MKYTSRSLNFSRRWGTLCLTEIYFKFVETPTSRGRVEFSTSENFERSLCSSSHHLDHPSSLSYRWHEPGSPAIFTSPNIPQATIAHHQSFGAILPSVSCWFCWVVSLRGKFCAHVEGLDWLTLGLMGLNERHLCVLAASLDSQPCRHWRDVCPPPFPSSHAHHLKTQTTKRIPLFPRSRSGQPIGLCQPPRQEGSFILFLHDKHN